MVWKGTLVGVGAIADPQLGYGPAQCGPAVILATIGAHAVVRRWNAPDEAPCAITAAKSFYPPRKAAGCAALIVHSRKGVASGKLEHRFPAPKSRHSPAHRRVHSSATTIVNFILDNAGDPNNDSFQWSTRDSGDTMSGPRTSRTRPMTSAGPARRPGRACAQVLSLHE
jgi:hypothetical protein